MLNHKILILGATLLTLAWWLWADRRLKFLIVHRAWRAALAAFIFAVFSGTAWVVLARRNLLVTPLPPDFYALVLLWDLLFLPFVALPMMLGWSLWSLARRIFPRKEPTVIFSPDSTLWSRRKWLGTVAICLPAVSAMGATFYGLAGITRFRIRNITVKIPDLPQALDGLRIAHVTDTHVGKFTRGNALDEIVAATNRLNADLVLFTGDLIDNTLRDLPTAIQMLQRMTPADRLFVIEGNHDLFDDPVAFEKGVRNAGLAFLRNQAATLQIRGVPVQILGIPWTHSDNERAQDVEAVAALRDPAAFPILLSHHPHAFDRATELGFPLTLAGHTHGGQLMITQGIGAGPLLFRYWTGLYQKISSSLVVSNGTGNWFPLRVNAPAEIVHLTLRKA